MTRSASHDGQSPLTTELFPPADAGDFLALQQAMDAMSDVYVVYDSEWRFVYQNEAQRAAMRDAGVDPDLAMGKVVWDVMPFLIGSAGEAGTRKAMTERVTTEWEESYHGDIRLHGRAFPTANGGVAVLARNITEQWKAEQRHHAAAERTDALQATTAALAGAATVEQLAKVVLEKGIPTLGAHAGFVACMRPDGISLEIIRSSGYPEELIDRHRIIPLHARLPMAEAVRDRKPVVLHSVEERVSQYPHLEAETRATGAGSVAAIPLVANDMVLGGLAFSFPVTRQLDNDDIEFMTALSQQCAQAIDRARLYEAEREARAAAEEANRAKTEFLTIMSHELRTPLNAIGGYAELMQAGIRGPVTEEQDVDLERIKRSQRHLLSLINDVLNFAKLQAGIVQITEREFEIDALAAGIEALITPQLIEKNLSFKYLPASEICISLGDPDKVEQILLNLLSNAIKFTDRGGNITLSVECGPSHVDLKVADSGSGISEDKLQAIFEPFVQLNRTRTSTNEGTGLGLSISRDLARAMGGELTVESVVGDGSIFTLRLPRSAS
ncbi:MAG: ATP-binding protein [Gemmatimonadales bacterium]